MDALSRFLRAETARPFGWGQADCLTLGADWIVSRTGADPAKPWRGSYTDEAGASAILAKAGGLETFARAAMTAAGLGEPLKDAHAVRGDVGLIPVIGPDGEAVICGICTGARWAARARRGLAVGRAAPVLYWRVGLEG